MKDFNNTVTPIDRGDEIETHLYSEKPSDIAELTESEEDEQSNYEMDEDVDVDVVVIENQSHTGKKVANFGSSNNTEIRYRTLTTPTIKLSDYFPSLQGMKSILGNSLFARKALELSSNLHNPLVARYCMKMGAHPNQWTSKGQTPLHLAVINNNIEFVKECIRQKEELSITFNEANSQGQLLVHLALAHNPTREIFHLLMAEGNNAKPRFVTEDFFLAFIINETSKTSNRTPFHTAVLVSDVDVINRDITQAIAENSVNDLNSTERLSGQTVLHTAAMVGNPEVLRALLSVNAIKNDINLEITEGGRQGLTPLYIAAGYGHIEAVELLIANGANVNQAAMNGETPIAAAFRQRFFDVVAYLREHGARLPDTIQNPVNPAQSTHEDTIHETVAQAAINLKSHYSQHNLTRALRELETWLQDLDHTDTKVSAALDAFAWLNELSYVEPISKVSFNEALALTWIGLNDVAQIIRSAPHAASDDNELDSLINARRKLLVQHLYEIERGGNLDEDGRDNNRLASRICTGGAFNKLIHTLHGHEKVFIIIVNNETILRKAEALCKERFFALPLIRQQELAKLWTMQNGFPSHLWNEVRESVVTDLKDAYNHLVSNAHLQSLIDIKVNRCIERQLEHAIPYMNPPQAVEQITQQAPEVASSSNGYLPALNSKKEKRKKSGSQATAKTSKKFKNSP
ncbi:ankyrin repeat domain-containing protein [Candidatus Berkiella aquae]|uniref:Ankyrin repeat domain-containing protein n=1 Tax=Candidatus Berkiella aquae TaxID=295108 RepID=A0A0Q9YFT0_9GAMM|nr:ankyrin repeat domain-containing protein [Candidatus Berkiella aquae]MCS5709874.1 ankyrin repeat domain-containing protein [Candidatus Berkiella aquae]